MTNTLQDNETEKSGWSLRTILGNFEETFCVTSEPFHDITTSTWPEQVLCLNIVFSTSNLRLISYICSESV